MANFSVDLSKWTAKTSKTISKVVREVVIGLAERIDERSPVGNPSLWDEEFTKVATKLEWTGPGYVGGHYRMNNQYGFGSPPQGEIDGVDTAGTVALAKTVSGVSAAPVIGVHYIVNNVPYAQAIEDGHSGQAPQGVYGLAAVDFQGIVDAKVARLKK